MRFKSIRCLQQLFKTTTLMELLYRDDIRAKINNLQFFLKSKMYHLYACLVGMKFWFYEVCERGDWIKVEIDESVLGEFEITEEAYLRLIGSSPRVKRRPRMKPETEPDKSKTGENVVKTLFLCSVGSLIGYQVWRKFKA